MRWMEKRIKFLFLSFLGGLCVGGFFFFFLFFSAHDASIKRQQHLLRVSFLGSMGMDLRLAWLGTGYPGTPYYVYIR